MSGGGSFGKSGSESSQSVTSPAAEALAALSQQFATESSGLRQQIIAELMAGLTGQTQVVIPGTGTSGTSGTASATAANPILKDFVKVTDNKVTNNMGGGTSGTTATPDKVISTSGGGILNNMIQKSVEASKRSTSQSLESVSEELARTGLAGTPFGIGQLANTLREGNYATSQIEPSMRSEIYNQILGAASNFVLGQGQTSTAGLTGAISGLNTTSGSSTAKGGSTSGGFNYKG